MSQLLKSLKEELYQLHLQRRKVDLEIITLTHLINVEKQKQENQNASGN